MSKVSVCIPTYNRSRFLKETIESVLAQTYSDFELIICDDGSTDSSVAIIKSFKDPRIRFFHNEKNIGAVANLNRCIELANGEYIAIFHDDDVMMLDNLKRKVKFLDENPKAGLAHSNFYRIDENGKIIGGHWAENPKEDSVIDGFLSFKRLISGGCFICCPSVITRRSCYAALGLFDLRFPIVFDCEMWIRISLHYDIGYISEPLIKYRRHSKSMSSNFIGSDRWREEARLARKISLENYHKIFGNKRFKKKEMESIYYEIGYFFLLRNNKKLARESFFNSLKFGSLKLSTILYLLFTFLPQRFVRFIILPKTFKNKYIAGRDRKN